MNKVKSNFFKLSPEKQGFFTLKIMMVEKFSLTTKYVYVKNRCPVCPNMNFTNPAADEKEENKTREMKQNKVERRVHREDFLLSAYTRTRTFKIVLQCKE